MKALTFFILVALMISSCKKDDDTAPENLDLITKEAYVGEVIRISGTNFDANASNNIVVFSGGKEVPASSLTENTLTVNIPEGAVSGPIFVRKGKTNSLTAVTLLVKRKYKWQALAPFPGLGRIHAIAFAVNGKGYVTTGATKYSGVFPNDLWEYDPATNKWTRKADFPGNTRYFSFSFVIDNKAYVGGGITNRPYDGTRDLYQYDPATNKWAQMASIPATDSFGRGLGVTLNGKGVVVNEADKHGVWQYNAQANTWTSLNNNDIYTPWGYIIDEGVCFLAEGKIYYGLGVSRLSSPPPPNMVMHQYDSGKNQWTYVDHQFSSSLGTQALGNSHVIDGKVFVSFDDYGTLNRFDPVTKKWNRFHTEILNVKASATFFTIGTTAYVIGGHADFYDDGSNKLYGFNIDPYIR
ncbi:kelch repeat-containing protein [Pedobacter sp. KR3-3]|uniref:Kelch repeat-containing protein n=1 Tax=Pedobacter albus TaxID=3113905 RepID=A0ABU7I9Q7_9SPHI|nr:kelch repeat-containing protein [Pedobacter sp. KR3-3]MEE1945939.1 kelch repeat-containing protein [Pedobacter sp. KR3-3]